MESPTTVHRYISQNTKKRVFPGGSSSSGCKEVEVLEIPPPINRTSKPKPSKQKEVIHHEIIDVDMEEDCGDVILLDGEVDRRGKGKEALTKFSAGLSSLANDGSPSDIQMSNNGTIDDLNSNLFYGEDAWVDTYYDDIIFDDDYATFLESQFDHMDIPPGVEAPFPWLPSSPQNSNKVPGIGTSTNPSSQLQPDRTNLSSSMKSIQIKDSKIDFKAGRQHMTGKTPSKWLDSGLSLKKSTSSSSKAHPSPQYSKYGKEPLPPFGKTKKRSFGPHVYSSPHNQFPSGATSLSDYPNFKFKINETSGGMPVWQDEPMHIVEPSMGVIMNESPVGPWIKDSTNNQSGGSSIGDSGTGRVEQGNADEIVQNLVAFKKFDTVEDYSDHHYSKYGSSVKQAPKSWAKRIQDEWKILEKDLPDTIFVRVYESRIDLLRAVIVGAEGTPYHDGLFFFDVFFPSSYPNVPPQVHYHSGGLRINPNLYNCGKVCLSLLNTWSGSHKEQWIPGVSTMLQVLVSIQGLILNAKPYFNEPGYANLSGSVSGEKKSLEYNERTFMHSLQTMVYTMRRPPKYFEAFVKGHFCKYARDILVSCKAYMGGAQVGCLVKGGVQDVDEGDKSCSKHFKTNLAGFITTLVNTFSQIGAKDCQEFLSLAQKTNGPAAPPPPGAWATKFYH
ncbi:hypothetical protein BUALT_Bualt03G0136600 [Buddleja alternifolia]|uniref:E2 ubiquitin-conjugating enzyme n=1 Tax=Buddleja alternifolia TaxID=168488 RepID=A0AAV6XUN3_9LAMI|nr:hypothetical protein BUALT_Bualt03G0136600 [Buddleja alternifolia]